MDTSLIEEFSERGLVGPMRVLSAGDCREFLDAASVALARQSPVDWEKGYAASSRTFFDIGTHPSIMAVVSQLLGDHIMLWGAVMPARAPGITHPWHSDIESSATDAPTVSVWVGIENTNRDSALQLIPYSHRFGVTVQEERHQRGVRRNQARTEDVIQWAQERDQRCCLVTPDATDGYAVFFHGHLWHHSLNTSSRPRRALLLQYAVPDARIRIPDLKHLDWPFIQYEWPRPACVMVRGYDSAGVNRFVDPPAPVREKFRHPLTGRVDPFRIPLPPDPERGWKPYPVFAGNTTAVDRLSCHISVLSPGHCPHPPHRHDEEEILVLLAGEVELALPDLPPGEEHGNMRLRPGDFVYYPAQFAHTLTSVGKEPANYLMFKWSRETRRTGSSLRFRKDNVFAVAGASAGVPGFRPRRVFHQATECLATLNCHVSTLTPGAGYAPHVDPYDVAIVLLQGEIETLGERVRGHGVVFHPAGEPHGIHNPGDVTAVYLVFEFHGLGRAHDAVVASGPSSQQRLDTPAPESTKQTALSRPDRTSRPIFVLGSGRSGTTLLQRVINAAPGAAIFGEHNGFLGPVAEAYYMQQAKGCAHSGTDDTEHQHHVKRYLSDPALWPGWINAYREEDLAQRYAAFIRGWFDPDWIDARRWGFKEIRYGATDRVIEMLLELFANGRFVFVVRNPVDAIASQRVCAFGEFEALLRDWIANNEAYMRWAEDQPERCRIVRYEDIVGAPEQSVSELYDWLALQDASAGTAVVSVPEGRYTLRPGDRLPRELLGDERLRRIFTDSHKLAARLGLSMPILAEQKEDVGIKFGQGSAKIGPFSDGRLIQCDAVVLALWLLCDGRRNLCNIESELAPVANSEDVMLALDQLLGLDVIALKPDTGGAGA